MNTCDLKKSFSFEIIRHVYAARFLHKTLNTSPFISFVRFSRDNGVTPTVYHIVLAVALLRGIFMEALQVFANFCKFLQHLFCFILHV